MKKVLIRLLKWVGGTLLAVVLLFAAVVFALNTDMMQNHLLQEAVVLLKEKLQTEVSIEKIHVNFFSQDVSLLGVEVEDQQHRKMLKLNELSVDLEIWRLLENVVSVNDVKIKGVEARLYKPSPDSVANYQFVLDAFKSKKKHRDSTAKDSVKAHRKLHVDISRVWLENIKVIYNSQEAELGSLLYKKGDNGRQVAEVRNLKSLWVQKTKKGPVDNQLRITALNVLDKKDYMQLSVEGLNWMTNNNKPRKNSGKPKRGFFDVGHFNVDANMNIRLEHLAKDSIVAVVTSCQAKDPMSGIDITNLKFRVETDKKVAHIKDFSVSLPNTTLRFDNATMQLPSKKEGRKLAYQTSLIKGQTLLKDISRVFAPVLKNFSEPLQLQVVMSGDDEGMQFRDVRVNTLKKDLTIKATGFIRGLKDKYKLQVHFDVQQMVAQRGSKERIISQFPVKKFMMKQLHNLGRIGYTGSFDVLWKREQFAGLLTTQTGNINFDFFLDENTKYVQGNVRTDSFELGKAMDVPGLKKVACKASFKFDISKPRTAIMRRKVGGKLPMGEVNAEVYEAKYKLLHVRNTVATLKSNGAIAEGNVAVRGKFVDILCSFSFTNTNEMQKMKIKPGIKFHKASDEAKAAKAERKEQKKLEKAARDSVKQVEKAARKAEKAARKAEKDAEKAARKAEKDAEKAARKAAKKAEKEARKAAKQAAKENADD